MIRFGGSQLFFSRCLTAYGVRSQDFNCIHPSTVVSSEKLTKVSDTLREYGFKEGQIGRIFSSPYSILNLTNKDLTSNLTYWLAFGVSDKLLKTLSSYPELLMLNPNYVQSRCGELMTLVTKKDIHKLLVTCPSVFLDDFQTVKDKVSYIVLSMGVEQKSIVKTYALQFSLHHIKCRHQFLCRAGHYKVLKKKLNPRNAPLDKVFSRNIDTFLKLSGLSEEEYSAFSECFQEEEVDLMELDDDEEDL